MKLKTLLTLTVATLFNGGCATAIPTGGEGVTKNGDPLVAEAMLGHDWNNTVKIMSVDGWQCNGQWKKTNKTALRKFPLVCSDGVMGKAVMSVNNVQAKANIVFTLDNGESGSVEFGFVN